MSTTQILVKIVLKGSSHYTSCNEVKWCGAIYGLQRLCIITLLDLIDRLLYMCDAENPQTLTLTKAVCYSRQMRCYLDRQ